MKRPIDWNKRIEEILKIIGAITVFVLIGMFGDWCEHTKLCHLVVGYFVQMVVIGFFTAPIWAYLLSRRG